MSVADFSAIAGLIEGILDESREHLSEEEIHFLSKNRDAAVEILLPIVEAQVALLVEDPTVFDGGQLYWALSLLVFLKEPRTFQFLITLATIESEVIDACLGNAFITESLCWMLAATCQDEWKCLTGLIEDPDLDEFVRGACVEAIAILVVREEISREEVFAYFKECFHNIIYEGQDDESLATRLVSVCMELWPGECMDEIRELFGMRLVDVSSVEIDDLIEAYCAGKEPCLEEFERRVSTYNPLYPLFGENNLRDKSGSEDLDLLSKEADSAYLAAEAILEKDAGPKKNLLDDLTKQGAITFDPADMPYLECLPPEEQWKIQQLHELIFSAPDEALQEARERIMKFPDNPVLYSHLYIIYCELNWKREAINLAKDMVGRFPGHLFGLIEYAKYLLRRGEAPKVLELFSGCTTLQEFYPDRTCFHAGEWQLFSHVMALYHIEIDDYAAAKGYLNLLEKIDPKSDEVQEVEERLKVSAFTKVLRDPRRVIIE